MGYDATRYTIGKSLTRQFLSSDTLADGGEIFVFDGSGVFPADYENEDLAEKAYLDLSDPDTNDAYQMVCPFQIQTLLSQGKLEEGKLYLFELKAKAPTGKGQTVGLWRVAPVKETKGKTKDKD